MKAQKLTFKDVLDSYYVGGDEAIKELSQKAPVHEVVLDMIARHLPNPVNAQKMRIPILWKGLE